MAHRKAAWGIEIGAFAIKAIRLEREGDAVSVSDFAVIPHKKVLTTPDLDQDEMVRLGLGQFISQKPLEGEHLVMGVPGHAAFARFAKLPPVEPKKVPDIVKFEAVQQIPFPIDQVEWDYQTFSSDDSPEVEVGIFAITRERVQQRLGLWNELGISPESLTLSPVAVYNSMVFDHSLASHDGPVTYLDIGTQASDLIVVEDGRCWIRTFPLGGSHFTEAIASAFKLSYSKAEKLKQEAATSKYAKQIMQAMRPVFSDLLQEVQRSIGYYQSLHRDAELGTMIGLGSTFKIPGLRKFLGQQLQITVHRLDEYKKISVKGREAASFAEHSVNMATAYGLALQGVGLATIDANLVPVTTLRTQMWHDKTKWFAGAAALVILGAGMTFLRPLNDQRQFDPAIMTNVDSVVNKGNRLKNDLNGQVAALNFGYKAENMRRLVDYRDIWPHIVHDAAAACAATDPQPALLSSDLEQIMSIPPNRRNLVQLVNLTGDYLAPEAPTDARRIRVNMKVEVSRDDYQQFLPATVAAWLRANEERPGVPYKILPNTVRVRQDLATAQTVTESGEVMLAGGTPGGTRTGGANAGSDGSNRFGEGGNRNNRTAGSGGEDGGGRRIGGAGGGGGGAMGRFQQNQPKVGAGGGNLAVGGAGQSGQTGNQDPRSDPQLGGSNGRWNRPTRGSTGPVETEMDIDAEAPLPSRPALYPADTRYHIVPITFEVELLPQDPAGRNAAQQPPVARANQEGEVTS